MYKVYILVVHIDVYASCSSNNILLYTSNSYNETDNSDVIKNLHVI